MNLEWSQKETDVRIHTLFGEITIINQPLCFCKVGVESSVHSKIAFQLQVEPGRISE